VSAIISIRNLHKRFGHLEVLKGIDLEIQPGEVMVVIGPSGGGKSTMLRCINHLEKYEKGEIYFKDVLLKEKQININEYRMKMGMVFQQFNLFPHLTVLENIMLAPMHVRRWPRERAEERARHWLARVGIPEQADKYPGQLSGGQQQRVAIARTLCMEPLILMFDEPTSALDPEMIKEVLDVMRDLATSGYTVLAVTHEMGFARTVADRVIFMDGGLIVEQNTPDEFFANPQHERTRQFLSQILSH
jgi:general L-amino acid transport system ATP-binding protein